MEIYLKKYFWMIHVAVVVACAVLTAKAVNHVVEAEYLLGEGKAKAAPRARSPKKAATPPKEAPSKDATIVATRNIFCSTCEPAQPEPAADAPEASDPNSPPITSLPIALVATSVSRIGAFSSATIQSTTEPNSGTYWMHEEIPGAGEILRVEPRFIHFMNRTANRVERLDLIGTATAPPPAPKPPPKPTPAPGSGDALSAELDKGVRKVGEHRYEIDRGLVDKVLSDPNLIARSARIVPSIKDGKANGFKMYAIRPNSVYSKIGLQNGDTIHAVNGFDITSPDKALEVYTKVRSASNLSIQVTRRGQTVTMDYSIK